MANEWDVWIVFGVLAAALVMFVGGWWRYDVVALLALMVLAVLGIVPAGEAFAGSAMPPSSPSPLCSSSAAGWLTQA
jgi:di/tricarboxylate transporter